MLVGIAALIHFSIRNLAAMSLMNSLRQEAATLGVRGDLMAAFQRNTKAWRTSLAPNPAGWTGAARRRLTKIREDANSYVQILNDRFTNPSGDGLTPEAPPVTRGEAD